MKASLLRLLIILLFSPWALAQENPGTTPEEEQSAETADAGEPSEEDADADTDEENSTPRDGDSPTDFVPTQQISEDLSVSFPVDI